MLKVFLGILSLPALALVIWLLAGYLKINDGAEKCMELSGRAQEKCMKDLSQKSKPLEATAKALTGQK